MLNTKHSPNAMFHTFQGLAPPRATSETHPDTSKPASGGSSKRITTPHACAPCARRKIRCDGRQPCGQCLGCRAPKPCYYDKHRQRVIPSRKTLDALQQSLEECQSVINRLFPDTDISALLPLSRQELLKSLERRGSITAIAHVSRSPTDSLDSETTHEQSPNSSLALLEQIPSQDTEWDEERRNGESIPVDSDDVNALSLCMGRPSSYLGAPSVKAALMPEEAQQMTELMMEEGMLLPDGRSVWDLNRMLWENLPNGLNMPFDGVPEDEGGMQYDYLMHHG